MNRLFRYPELASFVSTGLFFASQALPRRNCEEATDTERFIKISTQSPGFLLLSRLKHPQTSIDLRYSCLSASVCRCEERRGASAEYPPSDPPTPSWIRKTLASIHLMPMPLPRRLERGDPAFDDRLLRSGLRKRRRDERALRALQKEALEARNSRDPQRIQDVFAKVSEVAYGKGVTPQIREDFLVQFGCTGWTQEVLETLVELAETRGFVELGAGHGQWAKALSQFFDDTIASQSGLPRSKEFEFVLAYDDMTELPLSSKVYHSHTQAAHDYFYPRVQKCSSAETVLRQWACRGRVLLLVYPSPGHMALETIKTYVEMGIENDTVVLVGEGRGGANGNDDLFDYLENGEWVLRCMLPVKPSPGGKGYERMYVLQRRVLDI